MDESLLEILRCPVCKGELALAVSNRAPDGDIVTGTLACGACPFDYPIDDGIPNLLPPELQKKNR